MDLEQFVEKLLQRNRRRDVALDGGAVVRVRDDGIVITLVVASDDGNVLGEHVVGPPSPETKELVQLQAKLVVDLLRQARCPARLKTTKLVECMICGSYHPTDFSGDCREDGNRFPPPNDSDDESDFFDDGTPSAGYIPEGHGPGEGEDADEQDD